MRFIFNRLTYYQHLIILMDGLLRFKVCRHHRKITLTYFNSFLLFLVNARNKSENNYGIVEASLIQKTLCFFSFYDTNRQETIGAENSLWIAIVEGLVNAGLDKQKISAYKCKYFLTHQFEHMLWVLKRTVSSRRFF